MNIGLIDIDGGKWPNLALMKLSAYYKEQGATTELIKAQEALNGQSLFWTLDKIYGAVVFDYNKPLAERLRNIGVEVGGSGWDLKSRLPTEIEQMYPDYSLYPEFTKNMVYGFLTRGCPRQCKFCIVSGKEGGRSMKVADLSQFWSGQKHIKLLDPNLLACSEWENLLQQLIDSGVWVDFTQGLDIRLMTKEKAAMINQIKIKMMHFAWDSYEFKTYKKLEHYRNQFDLDFRRLRVYVLTNFNTTHEQDLDRIYKLCEIGYDPYVMIFDKPHAPKVTRYMQRWVNNKRIFRVIDRFDKYDHRVG